MQTTVIYHSADFDGIFCREIGRMFLPKATLIGWNFGDKPIPIPADGTVYVMDLPVDRVFGLEFKEGWIWERGEPRQPLDRWDGRRLGKSQLIWIDHHKSSIESHPKEIEGYRIDGVAACRLAWQWFTKIFHLPGYLEFFDRKVVEPYAVRLAGEYDIWDKRDPNAELFQHGLRSQELTEVDWMNLLGSGAHTASRLLQQGTAIAYAKAKENESIIKSNGFDLKWEGLSFLACNASLYNSHLFTTGIRPHHDALLGFCRRANGKWAVSLYGAPGRPDLDLSPIAVKHGGGGHRQACGFTCERLPFEL